MKKLSDKKLKSDKLPGADINVSATILTLGVFEITATAGQTTYTERHTIGADGSGPDVTLTSLQTTLDGWRQALADKAAWQENIRAVSDGLQ